MLNIQQNAKKLLACLLTLALLASCLAVDFLAFAEENAPLPDDAAVWDGTIAAGFASGSGSEADPYLIETPAQFAKMIGDGNATAGQFYRLTADLYFNDISVENWKEQSPRPWFSYAAAGRVYFQGHFDGDGHTLYGLYYKGSDSYVAAFPAIKGTVSIANLRVAESAIESSGFGLAAMVGFTGGGTFTASKCYMYESVSVTCTNHTRDNAAGGLFGYGSGTFRVSDCAVLAKRACTATEATKWTGAIVANTWSSSVSVSNTFAIGVFGKHPGTAGAVNCYTTESDSVYATDVVAAEDMKGLAAKTNMPKLDWNHVWTTKEGDYPVLDASQAGVETPEIWDGTVAAGFAGGTGTETDPYLIKTASQLARMVKGSEATAGKHYKLGADIFLNDVSSPDWASGSPRAWYDRAAINNTAFVGTLDGAGHTVHGLYYNGAGLFGLLSQASNTTVSNLRIRNADITSSASCSALIGFPQTSVTFRKCVVDETVKLKCTAASGQAAAGFAGYGTSKVTVEDSAVMADFTGSVKKGAFIGELWGAAANRVLQRSFSASDAPLTAHASNGLTVTDCYTVGTDTIAGYKDQVVKLDSTDRMKGAAAKTNMPKLDWAATWLVSAGGYPVMKNAFQPTEPGEVWSGAVASRYEAGSGTEDDPYLIATGEQMARLVSDTDTKDHYYKIVEDIKLNDTAAEHWTDAATPWIWNSNAFEGHLLGDGHTISGLYYNGSQSKVGLFCYTKSATLSQILLTDSVLTSSGFGVGAFIGQAGGNVSITACYATQTVHVTSTYDAGGDRGAGGFVGYGGGVVTIKSSAYLGTVSAPGNVGAFLGNCWATPTVSNSFAAPDMKFCTKRAISSSSMDNYSVCAEQQNGVTTVSLADMQGLGAKEKMPRLDWISTWKAVENGFPILDVDEYDGTVGEIWSGKIAARYAGGSGTKEDPYLVATGEQLARMASDGNSRDKYYAIVADIKLNDTAAENWTDTAKQWIWNSNAFAGNVTGNCHTVSGLYYNGDKSKVGLFCYTGGASLSRIILSDCVLTSSGFGVGAFIGQAGGKVSITECYATPTVHISSTYDAGGDRGAGGFVGYGGGAVVIKSSAYLGTVSAPGFAGAFLGNCWTAASVSNSFATPRMKFCSKRSITDSTSNYGTGTEKETGVITVSLADMQGLGAKEKMPQLDWLSTWKAVENGFPVLNVGEYDGVAGELWSGKIATGFAGGSGTEEDPYLISTGEQLALVVKDPAQTVGKHYKMTHDIYLNDVSDPNWEAEEPKPWFWVGSARKGNFNGHFDGDGHVVYGMYLSLQQTTDVVYTGLFSTISDGTVIEKLGISDSHMKVTNDGINQQAYVGALTGYVFFNLSDSAYGETGVVFPEISQCFGSASVVLEGSFCGLVAGAPRPANISDTYFIGKLVGERVAAIIGNSWTEYPGAEVTRCYAATPDADLLGGGRASVTNSATPIFYHDNYANSSSVSGMVEQMSLLMMRGEAAKRNMKALDFENVWAALDNGTPVLRIFGTTDRFSNTAKPKPIEVSFVSNGGTECASVYGNPDEPITLPTPTREGYLFGGWYVFRQLDVPFAVNVFPYFDQILYAKWISNGLVQGFEDYPNSVYDLGLDYEYYIPGAEGYDANYVYNGMASMHRLGNTGEDSDFLINYEELLTPGIQYTMSFYVTSDRAGTDALLSLVHEDYPDVYDSDSGVERIRKITVKNAGEWQKVEITFVARTQWLAIRSSGGASLFFDEIMISPVSETIHPFVKQTKGTWVTVEEDPQDESEENSTVVSTKKILKVRKKKKKNNDSAAGLSTPILVSIIAACVLVAAAAVIIPVMVVKRRRKKAA